MPRPQRLRNRLLGAACACAALLAGGCVDIQTAGTEQGQRQAVRLPQNLDLGLQQQETLHFLVKSHSREAAVSYGDGAEKLYQQLMQVTGLYSFVPSQPYELVILPNRQDYLAKTGAPQWSGGVTIGNAIVAYESPAVQPIVAHEMTHLIFNEFMETPRPELTWLNEGLAVSMERLNYSAEQQISYDNACASALKYGAVQLESLMMSTPLKEERTGAQAWYCQAHSVVSYLLSKGGSMGFSVLAAKLKTGTTLSNALNTAYNGQWADSAALERDWSAATGISANARAF